MLILFCHITANGSVYEQWRDFSALNFMLVLLIIHNVVWWWLIFIKGHRNLSWVTPHVVCFTRATAIPKNMEFLLAVKRYSIERFEPDLVSLDRSSKLHDGSIRRLHEV